MTPKEKANQLVDNYWLMDKINPSLSKEQAKQCALIAVDEILKALQVPPIENKGSKLYDSQIEYWQEVKEEIEKL